MLPKDLPKHQNFIQSVTLERENAGARAKALFPFVFRNLSLAVRLQVVLRERDNERNTSAFLTTELTMARRIACVSSPFFLRSLFLARRLRSTRQEREISQEQTEITSQQIKQLNHQVNAALTENESGRQKAEKQRKSIESATTYISKCTKERDDAQECLCCSQTDLERMTKERNAAMPFVIRSLLRIREINALKQSSLELNEELSEARQHTDIAIQNHLQDLRNKVELFRGMSREHVRVKTEFDKSAMRWMMEQEAFEKYIDSLEKDLIKLYDALNFLLPEAQKMQAQLLETQRDLGELCAQLPGPSDSETASAG